MRTSATQFSLGHAKRREKWLIRLCMHQIATARRGRTAAEKAIFLAVDNQGHNVLAPKIEGVSLFVFISMQIVGGRDASSEATNVTQDAFNDVRLNKLGEAGCNTSSDVVNNPRGF